METLEIVKSDYELERGKPIPTWNHAILQQRILLEILVHYPKKFTVLPELNLNILGDKLVPDLAVFNGLLSFLAHDQNIVSDMPLVVVEILSPSQSVAELTSKAKRYLQAGINSYWLVVPELMNISISSEIGIYQTFNRHEILRDPATGIELELAPLFS
ncbi:MAG: Uma2 family endonuclease [Hymenobacter sp.]|nr:MAG: Uma2 family endonuclease [Hymenobacter sp.]